MPIVESELAAVRAIRDLRPSSPTTRPSAAPAWLWRADGSRILWANAVGAAIFGAANAGDCAPRRFDASIRPRRKSRGSPRRLPPAGQARLERLRGFGASFGRALTCVCSRLALADGASRGPCRRNRAGRPGADAARAGEPAFAEGQSNARGVRARRDASLRHRRGADAPCRRAGAGGAWHRGHAAAGARGRQRQRRDARGPVTVERLGSDASTVLVATSMRPADE